MTFENYKINYDSVIIAEENLKEGYKRLLETDNVVLIPCQKAIRFVITSGDVLHSWAVPSLGIKTDAVPGRLNQVITMVCKPGVYYGQCSELCGVSHGFMPVRLTRIHKQESSRVISTTAFYKARRECQYLSY
jgi:cytochrome c oxidase subunit 2